MVVIVYLQTLLFFVSFEYVLNVNVYCIFDTIRDGMVTLYSLKKKIKKNYYLLDSLHKDVKTFSSLSLSKLKQSTNDHPWSHYMCQLLYKSMFGCIQ